MQQIMIKEDVRFIGVSYAVSGEPVQVEDDVAAELIKLGFASSVVEDGDPANGSTGNGDGDPAANDAAGSSNSAGQQNLFGSDNQQQ